jgi:two-component system, sensor histidine kinase and response regulator
MKSTVQSRSDQPPSTKEVMDVRDALNRLGDDEDLLRDIVQIFLEDVPGMIEKIHKAVAETDANSLQRAAHSLKGLTATLSAHGVVSAAAQLEHIATSRNLAEAAQAAAEVERRVNELTQAAQQFLRRK